MIKKYGCPQYCKIDVEGFEYEVLQGLSVPIPYISFEFTREFLNSAKECVSYLENLGYKYFNLALGENPESVFSEWVSPKILFDHIEHIDDEQLWGDIYANFEIKNENSHLSESQLDLGEIEVIEKFIASGNLIFDIGAYIGSWTNEVLKRYSNIQVHLFEPVPHIYQKLLQNLDDPLKTEKIFPNNCSIGSKEETQIFYYYEDSPSWSTFYRRFDVEKQYNLKPPKEVPVLTTTLDNYTRRTGIKHIHFLKIDVEGGELDVLHGAKELLRKGLIDYIQFEYGGTFLDAGITLQQIFEYLKQMRYGIFKISKSGVEHIQQFLPHHENFEYSNYLAVNEKASKRVKPSKFS